MQMKERWSWATSFEKWVQERQAALNSLSVETKCQGGTH